MKRIVMAVSAVAVLAIALNVMAFGGIGGKIQDATGGLSNVAIQEGINKDIDKKTKNCKFKPGLTELTCPDKKIFDSLTATQKAVEAIAGADVNVHFRTNGPNYKLARERYNAIRAKAKARFGYWDYYGDYNEVKSDPNGFKMWVEVR